MCNSSGSVEQMRNSSGSTVEQIFVPIMDSLILILGVTGQSLVMVILCRRQRRRMKRGGQASHASTIGTGTDILLLALSAADLLLLSMIPFYSAAIAMRRWPFGDVMCRLVGFLGSTCSSASIFTLAALAVSRYLIVVKPTRAYGLLTPRRVSMVAVLLWVPACCLGAPQLAFRFVKTSQGSPDRFICFSFLSHEQRMIYGLFHFLAAFMVPLVTIAVAYGSIYVFLWRGQQASTTPQVERYQSKVTQTTAMLVLAFTVCWLPSYGLALALLVNPHWATTGATGATPRYGAISVFARLMATSSTVMNPILYVLMSQKFRQDLLKIFKRERQIEKNNVVLSTI
ncbi:PREDICTED: delta-type opioid receptor-like [Poecilia mexicana]|uniref:delta-type opioid receptor-like n=1 Tax=Poecilia mexicana TaxID=48701 RepID=UPI00072DD195|nr:PREDICTED: delta-type opioid receptor-like [Poecilia mexicana]XP_014854973.1 PREDICTED: delta-type opioid receptor-like [Poecilia mexicana]XP_014854976.1 PREDICTED: delta-type opioid receptor-like [Poecilia mexicana]XP_014854977.1 PREDICTED: delta-type opioid receptor-like [Poecilia mexicana]XP_014854978.1 PREDICTED: delta-type opioid receptor-like [Poecilia mexicana]XP_014854979.1 PREDICTED: delta-type opioid receptor-like [Poecilia mexicana]XP_014854980.1 PREDICTED: delta-type opioid rec